MIYEKKDEKGILRWDMDENTRLPNGKLYNFIALSPTAEGITLPNGITEIGYGAFAVYQKEEDEWEYYTPRIEEIYIPSSVKHVENGAFAFLNLVRLEIGDGCTGLKLVGSSVLSGDGKRFLYTLFDGEYEYYKTLNKSFAYEVPSGVEGIGDEAFSAREMDVVLPDSVKIIRAFAFGAFEGSVVVPESVEWIEKNAFAQKTCVLLVKKGSYAHKWARKNKIKRKIIK